MLTINEQNQVKLWLEAERDGERFPVEFDVAWVMAGYAMKHHAKRRLTNQSSYLVKGEDYHIDKCSVPITQSGESTILGRSSDRIVMTCDAFKHFCLMAQTAKGREIRQYFIEAEKELSSVIPTCQSMAAEIERLKAQIIAMEDAQEDYKTNYMPKKFGVHCVQTPKTYVYTLVCKLQDNQYFNLMSYTLPWEIAAEPDLQKFSALSQVALAPLYRLVDILNEMSKEFTPAFEPVAYTYKNYKKDR